MSGNSQIFALWIHFGIAGTIADSMRALKYDLSKVIDYHR